ncbi:sugar transferase [Microbacterium sp. CFBP9023]|uniref:sugar transferase n=1 Tax=unclassified Microbacterium TaxID=2609290 RepID=UPI001E33C788|nr:MULTISPECIES: sugar transferase [unclassified Microbacterium]MDY0984781.1 sugar transferase [Microbacterium sp. CFBP9023]
MRVVVVQLEHGGSGSSREPSETTPVRAKKARRVAWTRLYASRLFYNDVIVVLVTLVVSSIVVLPGLLTGVSWPGGPRVSYLVVLGAIGFLWLVALDVTDSRDRHTVGHGADEYRRIVNASVAVFAVTVAIAFFLGMELSRALVAVVFPLGLVLLLMSRWMCRQWLRGRQKTGQYLHRAVVIGEPSKVALVAREIRRAKSSGYEIVGVITENTSAADISGFEVLGDIANVEKVLDEVRFDALIIVGSDDLDPLTMRRLGYSVSDRDIQLIMAPVLTDIAGPRMHATPVAGLPLVHVDFPRMEGSKRFLKRAFDIVGSSLLLVLLSPVFLIAAIAIRIEGPGSIFYHQERIGRGGKTFGMRKFRSMVADADDQLATLLDLQGDGGTPLFKINDDPRITRVGRFFRKHSIDELPQLIDVFLGDMSLVGPRPQRASEVALYDDFAHRRLLVKPGMSGLWQVSGRSSLSWEETIRLDLYYVENWSLIQDLIILFRTIRAVVAPGASAH